MFKLLNFRSLEFENRLLKPNYFYVPDPWEIEPKVGKCPFHHQA